MPNSEITLRDVYLASKRVRLLTQRTPLIESQWLSQRTGEAVYLKAECLQVTGSFKVRGATNKSQF